MNTLTIRKPDDFHLHLRQGPEMGIYAREAEKSFARALIMPNTLPPVIDPAGLLSYKAAIEREAPGLEALMAFKLLPDMDPRIVPEMKKAASPHWKTVSCRSNNQCGRRYILIRADKGCSLCHGRVRDGSEYPWRTS